MKALTPPEIYDLQRLEKVIQEGEKTFVEVGLALTEIKDRKLYRKDYDTFEAYCQEKWGWSRKRGYQLTEAAAVVQALPLKMSTVVDNERTARELAKLPPPQREIVIQKALDEGKPLTSTEVKKSIPPPPPPKQKTTHPIALQKDRTGYPIPAKIKELWNRAEDVQPSLLTPLSSLRGILRREQETKDSVFTEVNFSSVMANLDQAYADIATAKPFAVCPTCQGQIPEGCMLCKGRGFISEHRWNTCVPRETKEIRAKANR